MQKKKVIGQSRKEEKQDENEEKQVEELFYIYSKISVGEKYL